MWTSDRNARAVVPALLLLLLFPAAANAAGDDFHSFLKRNLSPSKIIPPEIPWVRIVPETPAAGEYAYVEAAVLGRPKNKKVRSVSLRYREKGDDKWKRRKMEDDGDGVWSADLPEWPAGTEIEYRIEARDEAGNLAVEAMAARESPFDPGCPDGAMCDLPPISDDWSPPIQLEDDDDADIDAPPYLDFLGLGVARASNSLIVAMKFEGEPSPGTFQPINANAYAALIAAGPSRPGSGFFSEAWLWAFAYHASQFGYPHAALMNPRDREVPLEQTGFRYRLQGPYIILEVDNVRLGLDAPPEEAVIVAGDLNVLGYDFQHVEWAARDLTPSMRVYFRSHVVTVE